MAAARSGDRNLSLDMLKVVMAVMVAGLHGGFLRDEMPVVSHFLVEGVFRLSVPTFFIISGFYLERQFSGSGAAKWFWRIAVMFVIWTILYSFAWVDFSSFSLTSPKIEIVTGYYHLWYLFGLMGGGAVFLVLRRLTPSSSALLVGGLLMFAIGVAIQYAGNWNLSADPWWDRKFNTTRYYRNFIFFAFPFIAIGVLISRGRKRLEGLGPYLPALLGLGMALLMTECALNYHFNGSEGSDIYASLILVCPLLFLWTTHLEIRGSGKALALVATCIFLLHPMVQLLMDRVVEPNGTTRTLVSVAISAALAPVIIWLNRRVPLV